jgi:hypothetical protein
MSRDQIPPGGFCWFPFEYAANPTDQIKLIPINPLVIVSQIFFISKKTNPKNIKGVRDYHVRVAHAKSPTTPGCRLP